MIRVVVVDDQFIISEGLKLLLSKAPDLEVVGSGSNGLEALELVERLKPDVLLLDIRMPEMDGVETIGKLRARGDQVKIIILTTFDDDQYILEGMSRGAQGYLLKDASPAQIADAVRAVAGGSSVMAPGVAARMMAHMRKREDAAEPEVGVLENECFRDLTERERDIVKLIAEGKTNQEIGETLFLTEGTVKNHITRILSKCGMRDRTQLAVLWLKGSID
jgi:DNA-binding NarL/FixJ family response regulator